MPPQPPKEGSDLPTASPQICRDGASPCPGSITLPASSMGGMLLLPAIRSSPQQPQPLPGGRGGGSVVTLVTVASTFPEVLVPLCFGDYSLLGTVTPPWGTASPYKPG